ncbi:hypothetical protein TWF506_001012 [Arthrobotrys conoides]|uniref:Uncharacterized protein n=1 Tax=Arthrobotrys conoides TaxID=74498 RepID=A0AAN8P1B1_9PEZI
MHEEIHRLLKKDTEAEIDEGGKKSIQEVYFGGHSVGDEGASGCKMGRRRRVSRTFKAVSSFAEILRNTLEMPALMTERLEEKSK